LSNWTYIIRGMKSCLNCNKEIGGKATYCSEKCSKAYRRRTKQGEQPGQNDPNYPDKSTRTLDFELTRTDLAFDEWQTSRGNPNYYNFDKEVFERVCFLPDCEQKFKTHLKLLKYCSPKHYVDGLGLIVRLKTKGNK